MGRFIAWVLALLLWSGPGHAQAVRGVADPHAFLTDIYRRYEANPGMATAEPRHAYSRRLAGLFSAYERDMRGSDLVGSLDFDWWINAQDGAISQVRITPASRSRDRVAFTVRWLNGDRADRSRFIFLRAGRRWVLDEVVNGSGGGSDGWTLSALLRERPE